MTESFGKINQTENRENKGHKENLNIDCAIETQTSINHEHNQDSTLQIDEFGMFGVFDGMSGHQDGDIASKLAVSSIEEYIRDNYKDEMSMLEIKDLFKEAFAGANSAILVKRAEDGNSNKMGTTGTVFKVGFDVDGSSYCVVAHVGDSRLYVWNEGELEQITTDDDLLHGENFSDEDKYKYSQIISNATKPSDIPGDIKYYFENRNVITKYLGRNSTDLPKVFIYPITKRSKIIATTDGIHDNLTTDEIKHILKSSRSAKEVARRLKERAIIVSQKLEGENFRAKPDDMTVIAVELKG